jgi:hypothetical protein
MVSRCSRRIVLVRRSQSVRTPLAVLRRSGVHGRPDNAAVVGRNAERGGRHRERRQLNCRPPRDQCSASCARLRRPFLKALVRGLAALASQDRPLLTRRKATSAVDAQRAFEPVRISGCRPPSPIACVLCLSQVESRPSQFISVLYRMVSSAANSALGRRNSLRRPTHRPRYCACFRLLAIGTTGIMSWSGGRASARGGATGASLNSSSTSRRANSAWCLRLFVRL